jgi:hypothetical protein
MTAPEDLDAARDLPDSALAINTPLSRFWSSWNRDPDPAAAFAGLDAWIDSVATGGRLE